MESSKETAAAPCESRCSSAGAVDIAKEILECAGSWDCDARLLGNVRAADVSYAIQWLIGRARTADKQAKAIETATKVVRLASVGDQNFIRCLRGGDRGTTELRYAMVHLAEDISEAGGCRCCESTGRVRGGECPSCQGGKMFD